MRKPSQYSKPWTKEEDAILREGRGRRSASMIGDEIGRTRNAVIGRWHRLGFNDYRGLYPDKHRKRPQMSLMVRKDRRKKKAQEARSNRDDFQLRQRINRVQADATPPISDDVWMPLAGIKPVSLYDIAAHHCRWPVTGGSCGCPKTEASSYCSTHKSVARA